MFHVQNIDAQRGTRRVLTNVSFSLNAGACLFLRGPNGSGKTTLLRTLAGLTPPSAGTINVNPDEIVYTAHLDAVKPQLTVAENIAFWHAVYQTKQTDTLTRFNLSDLAQRDGATLSAGQKRRLGLARLHISGCKIWLLDEPTTALDANHVAQFAQILTDHCSAGGIAVVSTHLDLPIPHAQTLNVAAFGAEDISANDPFLEGAF
ncbi:heme ABC exporter ATP-binding protein CcmA [Amylibacter sp. IMCC11727]|uniref:heme ABC exporter ATP-binding protein CcmA n=1 Tax=Amylibacter sp. IMCC11727 TaxID=3039851 RepID=UPI00244E1CF5|nr:heme ABC exporter ATP-binding protein CcmA [Amylibacter sp. IMCC11727]WGI20230.1 heme ABC exporter ATP-binding protein CcmA [Amylibacter sp. IMCC11727]